MSMNRYLIDYISLRRRVPPLDLLKAVVSGRTGTIVGNRLSKARGRALKRLAQREAIRAEIFGWLTDQGYDHHFSYEEIKLYKQTAQAVYLNVADREAAVYLRLRYNVLPLEEGQTAYGDHGTWGASLAD